MTYTSHGHHIPFTFLDEERPKTVEECGGVRMCFTCTMETARYLPAFSGLNADAVAEQLKLHLREYGGPAQAPSYLMYENTAVAALV